MSLVLAERKHDIGTKVSGTLAMYSLEINQFNLSLYVQQNISYGTQNGLRLMISIFITAAILNMAVSSNMAAVP